MSIGEFASRSQLSAKALRLYDELGLLPPAQVDEDSGYRFYEPGQLEQARLIAALRQLQMSLAEIKAILAVPRPEGAQRLRAFWAEAQRDHADRRVLAEYLIDDLSGKRSVMYDVSTRDVPERSLLCLKRHVVSEQEQWAFGKEFIGVLRRHELPRMEGSAGAWFCIYWGEVNEDSDGPVEWCRPIPTDEAEALAARCPELTLRAEPAHQEAFVELGHYGQVGPADWQVISRSLHDWADQHAVRPIDLGARLTYLVRDPPDETRGPDLDFAVPFEASTPRDEFR